MTTFMDKAIELAKEALTAQEVPVGCVFVADEKVVARSRNTVNETRNPTRHAEINCIDTVLEYCKENGVEYKDFFSKITVYVTVEPCIMCAAALHKLNVHKVVYGCGNDRFGGKTVLDVASIYDSSYLLYGNMKAEECMSLLKEFYKGSNPLAPESKQKKKK